MSTNSLSAKAITREWREFDVKGKLLGRVSTEIAKVLMGKNKPNYVPYLDNGDYVVVTNAKEIRLSGKKENDKKYIRHSGYRGGLKVESFNSLLERRPEQIIRHAVSGMLPKNKLGKKMIKKLYVYGGSEHPYSAQLRKEHGA